MGDGRSPPAKGDRDDVEAGAPDPATLKLKSVSAHPCGARPLQGIDLPDIHCFERMKDPGDLEPSCLDLDEDKNPAILGDDIDLAGAGPDIYGDNLPPAPEQIEEGAALTAAAAPEVRGGSTVPQHVAQRGDQGASRERRRYTLEHPERCGDESDRAPGG